MCIYIYIYIYISLSLPLSIYIYIYIYIYTNVYISDLVQHYLYNATCLTPDVVK